MEENERRARIRELNDLARHKMGIASKVVITQGVAALGPELVEEIRHEVEMFKDFTPDNDPHDEHDAGFLYRDHAGVWTTRWPNRDTPAPLSIMWKIDYYDRALQFGSEEPWNPAVTERVLTILLTSEY